MAQSLVWLQTWSGPVPRTCRDTLVGTHVAGSWVSPKPRSVPRRNGLRLAVLKSAIWGPNPSSPQHKCVALTLSSSCMGCGVHEKHQALLLMSQVPKTWLCVWEHGFIWMAFYFCIAAPHVQLCGLEA